LTQAVTAEPERPSSLRPDLHPQLEVIVMKAMAKNVEDRYGSMAALATALDEHLEAPRPVNRIAALRPAPIPTGAKWHPRKPPRWRRAVALAVPGRGVVLLAGIVIVFRDKNNQEQKSPSRR
jgi:hypothetical protein